MRRIVTRDLYTHIEGVFSGADFGGGLRMKEPRKSARAKGRRRARIVATRTAPTIAHSKRAVKNSRV
jgi:hypothetical protein